MTAAFLHLRPGRRRHTGRLVATGVLVLALGLPMPAAADPAERRRAALLVLESDRMDALIFSLSAAPVRRLLAASVDARPGLGQGDLFALSALYHQEMHSAALGALSERAEAMARRYSLGELQALGRFAETPGGRDALEDAPAILGGIENAIARAMRARMDAALARHTPPVTPRPADPPPD